MKEKNGSTQNLNIEPEENLSEILDKLLVLQEQAKEPSFLRKTIYVVAGIISLIFVGLLCVTIYKNSFSVESILSTLLAFFSIFISVFFYFKADETSSKFYDSSYRFMKDISVTLGKIEERFGEKLNSLNDKVSHLDRERKKVSEEIEDKQEDKDRMINELMEKANLNAEEKAAYKKELEKKEMEIAQLQSYRMRAEREAAMLRRRIERTPEVMDEISTDRMYVNGPNSFARLNPGLIQYIIELGKLPDDLPVRVKNTLKRAGCIDPDGNVIIERLYKLRNDAASEY